MFGQWRTRDASHAARAGRCHPARSDQHVPFQPPSSGGKATQGVQRRKLTLFSHISIKFKTWCIEFSFQSNLNLSRYSLLSQSMTDLCRSSDNLAVATEYDYETKYAELLTQLQEKR